MSCCMSAESYTLCMFAQATVTNKGFLSDDRDEGIGNVLKPQAHSRTLLNTKMEKPCSRQQNTRLWEMSETD